MFDDDEPLRFSRPGARLLIPGSGHFNGLINSLSLFLSMQFFEGIMESLFQLSYCLIKEPQDSPPPKQFLILETHRESSLEFPGCSEDS